METQVNGQALADEVLSRLDAFRQTDRSKSKRRDNWASDLKHPCPRYLTYCRTAWAEKRLPTIDLEYRFETGRDLERLWKQKLEEVGVAVNRSQNYYDWPEYQIVGKIDGELELPGRRGSFPLEIKSIHPNLWDATSTIGDIKTHPSYFINKITFQLNAYLLMIGKPLGFLFMVTFGRRPRVLPMELDYGLGEEAVQKASLVNKHVAAGTLPDRMPYKATLCGRCDFDAKCLPVKNTEIVEAGPEVEGKLERMAELEDPAQEYKGLKAELVGGKERPGLFYGKDAAVGRFLITSRLIETVSYKVPPEIRAKYKAPSSYYRTEIDIGE